MAKKKPQPKKGAKLPPRKAPKRAAPKPDVPAGLPDPRAMEGVMWGVFGRPGPGGSPVEQAQDLMYQAFDEPSEKKRIALARKALELSPDCADAYVLLAEHAPTHQDELAFYEQGVAAGERAIGRRAFRENAGHFWGVLETRPYMRAREGLAHSLWVAGRREEAAAHLRDMLRLNPGDNQGVRYTLAPWLLELDRDEELAELLKQYEDDGTATWAYARALLAFRREGDTPAARAALDEARRTNAHVPAYLLGDEPLPRELPPYYSIGHESEAVMYVRNALPAWRSTAGALTWLRGAAAVAKTKRPPKRAATPSAAAKGRLKRLPQESDVWIADCRQLDSFVQHEGRAVQPWLAVVVSVSGGQLLAQAIDAEPPTAAAVWDVLAQAMREPHAGPPHRPTEVQLCAGSIRDELYPHLESIGVRCTEIETPQMIDALIDELTQHLTADEPPGLLEMPGLTPERVASFYGAAAEFYRKAPWKHVRSDEIVRVACDRYSGGPWYALVMGQSGMVPGLTLYEDFDLLRRVLTGGRSDEENARETVALTVTFDLEMTVPTADLLAARRHGWDVAGPEAYPVPFRKERGLSMRPPLAWELELLEACLQAIPGFLSRHPQGDTTAQQVTVPVATGEVVLAVSRIDEV